MKNGFQKCLCGCGKETNTRRNGTKSRYLPGHNAGHQWENPEIRKRIIASMKGYKQSEDSNRKRSETMKLKFTDPKFRETMRLSKIGHYISKETKQKIRIANTGHIVSLETRRKIGLSGIGRPSAMKGKHLSIKTRRMLQKKCSGWKHTPEAIEKIRLAGINRICTSETRHKIRKKMITHKRKLGIFGQNIGKHETQILDSISQKEKIVIKRQFEILGYFVDGYCKETNTVYEIDEKKHRESRQKLRDYSRQREIESYLHCKFIRIEEETWIKSQSQC
jgi:very-short-patch-repair endonuclease